LTYEVGGCLDGTLHKPTRCGPFLGVATEPREFQVFEKGDASITPPLSFQSLVLVNRQYQTLRFGKLVRMNRLVNQRCGIVPMRPYAERARSYPEPSPEQFGGLVRRSRSREFVRPWHTQPTPRTGGLARGNFELFPFRCRDRTATSRWLSLMSGRSWLQPQAYLQDSQFAWQ